MPDPETGTKPTSLDINGTAIKVSTWKDVLFQTAAWLRENGHTLPIDQVPAGRNSRRVVVSQNLPNIRRMHNPRPLSDDLFIDTCWPAHYHHQYARWLDEQAGLPPGSFHVEF